MIIVSGKLYVHSGTRDAFLKSCLGAIKQARETDGCHDFVVAADPLELDRVNVYEEWNSGQAFLAFRGEGMEDELSSLIQQVAINQHEVTSSRPA